MKQRARLGLSVSMVIMLAVALAATFATVLAQDSTPVSGDGVVPQFVSDNPDCGDLGYDNGFKIDGWDGGDFPTGGYLQFTWTTGTQNGFPTEVTSGPENNTDTISIQSTDGVYFDWMASLGIDAVIVKGGPDSNAYVYVPKDQDDTGLSTPGAQFEISHVEFCYNDTPPPEPGTIIIVKDDTTDSDTSFGFNENIEENGFSLQDPSDNTETFNDLAAGQYSVIENVPQGWTLDDISCVEDGTENSSGDTQTGEATINLEEGETVTCTFTNSPIPPETGALEVTKVVEWGNTTPDENQTFEICIQGPSYPNGDESGACQQADFDGETLSWADLQPGQYVVTETDPGSSWTVQIAGSPATVVAGQTAEARVTNTYVPPTDGNFCPVDPNVGNEMTKLIGTGQGSWSKGFKTRKLVIPNYQDVAELYGQLAAVNVGQMRFVRFRYPDKSYITIKDPTSPAHTAFAVNWWGSDLTPAKYIKGQFFWRPNASKTPRAFVLWPTYNTDMQYANVFEVFDESSENHVYWNEAGTYTWYAEQTQLLDLPSTQIEGADIVVVVALVDNNNDDRPVVLTVTALPGGQEIERIMFGPNAKDTLNMEEFLLENVPAGTNQIQLHLLSPEPFDQVYNTGPDGGDSVAMIGAAASYACLEENSETTAGRTLASNGR